MDRKQKFTISVTIDPWAHIWKKNHKPLIEILLSKGVICNFMSVQSHYLNYQSKKYFKNF